MIAEAQRYVWVAAFGLALLLPGFAWRGWTLVRRAAAWLGARPAAWVLVCGAIGTAVPWAGARFIRWPEPSIHDEFAYLLMAETFAEGRCAMPTHPNWEHFETFHVMQRPSYAAKYPPAMGVPLALGIKLFGEPRAGLWLQSGLLAAALAWMFAGWLPARWAVLGTLLVVARFCFSGHWVHTFYYGAVAAAGGALVLGGLARVLRAGGGRPVRARDSVAIGLGFGLLGNSRPFEGSAVGVIVALVLLAWCVRRVRAGEGRLVWRGAWPGLAVTAVAIAGSLLYARAVTGDALNLPYSEYDAQYSVYPPFLWWPVWPEPEFQHALLRDFALGFQRGSYGAWGDTAAMVTLVKERAIVLGRDFATWPLVGAVAAALVAALARGRGRSAPRHWTRRAWLAAAVCAALFGALCTTSYLEPRYAAPVVGALGVLVVTGVAGLGRIPGLGARRGGPLALAFVLGYLGDRALSFFEWRPPDIAWFGNLRAGVCAQLDASPGEDLVFVRCVEGHSAHHEWVVNAARIDAQPIVWARDMGAAANAALIARYPGREVWLLVSGDLLLDGPKLTKYAAD